MPTTIFPENIWNWNVQRKENKEENLEEKWKGRKLGGKYKISFRLHLEPESNRERKKITKEDFSCLVSQYKKYKKK